MDSTSTLPSFSSLLHKLATSPPSFTAFDAHHAFLHLCSSTPPPDVQIASFLTALKLSNLDQQPAIIAVAAQVLRDHANRVDIDRDGETICDIVGTGGDGHNAFNVSTTAAIVAAGAGCRVCKHGNKAASSSSGSADILTSMGVPLSSLHAAHITALLSPEKNNTFSFLFAPNFHPVSSRLAPLRRTLGFPTIFNVLGPLLNPAKPDIMIVGVNALYLGPVFAQALKTLEVKRAWVVHGSDGLDELTPAGSSHVWSLENGEISERTLSPSDFDLTSFPLSLVSGGGPEENAALLKDLLDAKLEKDHPILNFVLLNTAPLIYLNGKASSLKEAVGKARESIVSGRAKEAFERFKEGAREIAGTPSESEF
ncbi:anthranilate phosphoribosyltransferase [Atractiella rhizophila]|nr:anthranilate phosphoribosyltransferase [Atractiella rhizophila]